jgi:hypothetical protein
MVVYRKLLIINLTHLNKQYKHNSIDSSCKDIG